MMNTKSNFIFFLSLLAIVSAVCAIATQNPTPTSGGASQPTAHIAPFTTKWTASLTDSLDPVLYFSDITSGPKTGNSDTSGGRSGLDGAIVTIWGRNLGNVQGGSKVYANSVEAASYYSWGNATAPADLYTYHQMQMISFQVSHLAQNGLGSVYIVVNGRQSNSLPFTVRAGNLYFVKTTGQDDTGDGGWGSPWRTIPKAADSLARSW